MAARTTVGMMVVSALLGGCFEPALKPALEVVDDTAVDAAGDAREDAADTAAPDSAAPADTAEVLAPDSAADTAEVSPVDCTAPGSAGLPCDDGDACTRDDRCSTRGCEGIPFACDDGLACTEDRCDGRGGCTYPVAEGACKIGEACFAVGAVKADDPCRVCAGGEAWSPNDGGACEDGDEVCTLGDTCAGLVCQGGPRPSDAATDWALRPLISKAPSNSSVVGLARAFLDPVVIAQGDGPTTIPTFGGDLALAGDSIAVLRNTVSGLVPSLILDGFSKARVAAFASEPTSSHLALAVKLEGAGWIEPRGGARTNVDPGTRLLRFDLSNETLRSEPWPYEVEALGAPGGGRLIVVASFSDTYEREDLPGLVHSNIREVDAGFADLVVVSENLLGAATWATHIGSLARLGAPSVCNRGDGSTFVSTVFRGAAQVRDIEGPNEILSESEFASYVITRITADGSLAASMIPAVFESEPEVGGFVLQGPKIVDCADSGMTLLVHGLPTGSSGQPMLLTPDTQRSGQATLVRFDDSGQVVWSVRIEANGVMTTQSVDDGVLAAVIVNASGKVIDSSAVETVFDGMGVRLVRVDSTGQVTWHHKLSEDGLPLVASLQVLPRGAIAIGGTSLWTAPTFLGADSELTLPNESDFSAFLALLNSNQGLECATSP